MRGISFMEGQETYLFYYSENIVMISSRFGSVLNKKHIVVTLQCSNMGSYSGYGYYGMSQYQRKHIKYI